ncbi:hypothetical protein CISIN_1g011937mg [Citrus sinensis]|uniref:Dehydrogenase E1 component domain-containing protein n=1 Tax=Citrus sinensis TaxID=2711 RepID=A0A067GV60_CITSI|nr:hypothetical protein CISIN_1g011937mg [Citrus sinensis]
MAIWLTKSRAMAQCLRQRVGLLRILSGQSCSSPSTIFPLQQYNSPSLPSKTLFSPGRSESTVAANQLDSLSSSDSDDDHQVLDFPGGKVGYTSEMRFIPESSEKRVPCFRVLDDNGELIKGSDFQQVSKEVAVKMYSHMVTLQVMDSVLYEAQRQGRFSFYLTTIGEEAINIGSAAALSADDFILPQYREPGVLLWRGYTLQQFANQVFANKADDGKGRQMPIHYGSKKLNYITISSPIATQLPQAVGVAYSLKMEKKDACAVAYTGDGGTSEQLWKPLSSSSVATMAGPLVPIYQNNFEAMVLLLRVVHMVSEAYE